MVGLWAGAAAHERAHAQDAAQPDGYKLAGVSRLAEAHPDDSSLCEARLGQSKPVAHTVHASW